jgi:hypothetical protein
VISWPQLTIAVCIGPVTDYGASVVHWMLNRQPRYRGSFKGEVERPSQSYIVDVSLHDYWVTERLILTVH